MTLLVKPRLSVRVEKWPLAAPFTITGNTWEAIEVVVVELASDGAVGRGEAAGVYYRSETPSSIVAQIEGVRSQLEARIDRSTLQSLLPAGGARNALDCAMWDLEAKVTGKTAREIAGLEILKPLITTFTCGADSPEAMALRAQSFVGARAIKLKLTGEAMDAARVLAVRDACPDVWLSVDANQGFNPASLEELLPVLIDSHVQMIEQPFPVGQESLLDSIATPIPIAADESVQTCSDLAKLSNRFSVINIKLDKSGGLTEALAMAREARRNGIQVMVGNMMGTSLAMAPAFLVGQLCDIVDLDGPALLARDREPTATYSNGAIDCSEVAWGQSFA